MEIDYIWKLFQHETFSNAIKTNDFRNWEKVRIPTVDTSFSSVDLSVVYPWICIIVIACFLADFSLSRCSLLICRLYSFYPSILLFVERQQHESNENTRETSVPPQPDQMVVDEYVERISSNDSFSLLSCAFVDRSFLICINVCDDRRWSNFNILTLFYQWKREREREKKKSARVNINCEARSCRGKKRWQFSSNLVVLPR